MARATARCVVLSLLVLLAAVPQVARGGGGRRSAILMIGDGLGPQQLALAWLYSERVLHRPLCMTQVMRRGATGYLVNDTADALVTESAAAATQMATGRRAVARVLSRSPEPPPDGTPWPTVLELAQARGMATGLVTTSGITDATPGAFAAHVLNRSWEDQVAAQELAHGVDVLLGGRRAWFLPRSAPGSLRRDDRDLLAEARAAGYAVVEDAPGLAQVAGGKVLGLFAPGNMTYELDRDGSLEPRLPEMAARALALLGRAPRGFFVMIEGGRIDHAAHAGDAAGVLRETLAFDEAVCVALEHRRRHPDTLLVVTSDHETGGMALIGHGKESAATGTYVGVDLEALSRARMSMERLAQALSGATSTAAVRDQVRQALGVELTEAEAQLVLDDAVAALDPANYSAGRGETLAFVLRPYLRVAFATSTHTASPLFVYGVGPGAGRLAGFHHNTEIFGVLAGALRGR